MIWSDTKKTKAKLKTKLESSFGVIGSGIFIAALFVSLPALKKNPRNREALRDLIESLGLSQQEAADFLSAETRREISLYALRSWLCDPATGKARTCPNWPIKILKER